MEPSVIKGHCTYIFWGLDSFSNIDGLLNQSLIMLEIELRGCIAAGFHGVRMGFNKQAIGSGGHSGESEMGDKARLSAGGIRAGNTVESNNMRRIKAYRSAQLLHNRDGADVGNKAVVAKARTPFCQ